ncbi:coiled-coil domain-containing protein 134 [Sergentomyia squamirostris]
MKFYGFEGVFLVIFITSTYAAGAGEDAANITPKIYSNMFVRKREEHRLLRTHLKALEAANSYEKQFKLLQMAYEKILQIIDESRKILKENDPVNQELPTNGTEMESLFLLLENTCLFGDLLLHMPDISYKVLGKKSNWRRSIDYAWKTTMKYEFVIDEKTTEMLELFNQEINEDKRSEDFVNPYRQKDSEKDRDDIKSTKKPRKKLKRGPQLSGGQRTHDDL